MLSTLKRKALFMIPLLMLVIAVSLLAIKRVRDRAEEKASLQSTGSCPLPIRGIRAVSAPIHALVFGEGTARAVRREFLTFERQGKVTYVKKNKDGQELREGDRVRGPKKGEKLGELLASLDKRDYLEQLKVAKSSLVESEQRVKVARAQVEEAEAQQQLATDNFKRRKELFKHKAIPKYELDVSRTRLKTADTAIRSARANLEAAISGVAAAQARIKQARLPLERTSIYAPFDGIVAYVNIKKGDYFSANLVNTSSEEALLKTVPMVVINPNQFEVTMELPAFEGALVKPGQPSIIMTAANRVPSPADLESSRALQDGSVRGKVFSVSPAISPGGRSIQVKVRTEEGNQNPRDGMFVTCWIVVEEKAEAIVVPFDVFIYRQNRPYVFVVDEIKGRVEQREVVEGIAGITKQEILRGVSRGTLLVTDGRHGLSNGAPIEVIEIIGENENEPG